MQATEWVLLNLSPTDTILDVGIGKGSIWKDKNLNVKGFDINNSNPGVEVTMGNVCLGLPFQSKSFSLGVMVNTIEALPESCKQHAVNELMRVASVVVIVSKDPVVNYTNVPGVEHISDAVEGIPWFGAIINRQAARQQAVTPPVPEPAVQEVQDQEPEVSNEPEPEPDEENDEEKPQKKKPFWKRKIVRGARYASILVGLLNFIKYLFSHETITVPVEFTTLVPIVGGSITHYRIAMATYDGLMTLRNYISKS